MNIKSDLMVNQLNIRSYLQTSILLAAACSRCFSEMLSRMDLEMRWFLVLVNGFIWQSFGAVGSGSDKSCPD